MERTHQAKFNKQYVGIKQQQGVALIVALFIMALTASMAYLMVSRLARDTRRTHLLIRNAQAEWYAAGSIAWAMDQLRNNWEQQKPKQMIDSMPLSSPVQTMNGYQISSTIEDMEARFNLNQLSSSKAQKDFMSLLHLLAPKLSDQQVNVLTQAIADWVTPSTQHTQYSAYYLNLPVPYQPAHRPMTSVTELALVKGMTPALFQLLEPYVTALPAAAKINVQTATAPVLMTLSPSMTAETARLIIQQRAAAPIVTVADFLNLDIVKNHAALDMNDKISVLSYYFLVKTEVSIEEQHITIYTLLERALKDKQARLTVLWQSKHVSL